MKEVIENEKEKQLFIDLELATFVVRSGGTLVYPTDTVWGIGCDATNEEAVEQVLELKKTEDSKALIVLVDSLDMAKEYLKKFPQVALNILSDIKKPTTIIYPGANNIAKNVIAEDGSIGIRITTNSFCKELIKRIKKPIVSTSANISGEPTPKKFNEINIDITYNADYVVRWGQDEDMESEPSAIIKILDNGETLNIRN